MEESAGSELFRREWRANDPRGHGDGLGPVYNATSCAACHRQAGPGGAGPADRNVQIVTPIAFDSSHASAALIKEKTGLASLGSVVLHRFGTNPHYAVWRSHLLKKDFRQFTLVRAQTNTPALFGDGRIDAIPDAVLIAAETRGHPDFPELHGRVSRLRDGRIGRFGWKGHTASLRDFVLTACSVELGLEVPGHHQSPDPTARRSNARALDLTEDECDELVDYVRSLRPPVERDDASAEAIDAGKALFAFVGCASCHTPRLGDVDGLYSDLLLHDMGATTRNLSAYGRSPSPGTIIAEGSVAQREVATVVPAAAGPTEWRTPPLWGVADSAPYLHDGRAKTLFAAIRLHGGEADETLKRYLALTPPEQEQVLLFLLTLRAPSHGDTSAASDRRQKELRAVKVAAWAAKRTIMGSMSVW
jgi:CxxC motif-containing protein (DUF1111 family)